MNWVESFFQIIIYIFVPGLSGIMYLYKKCKISLKIVNLNLAYWLISLEMFCSSIAVAFSVVLAEKKYPVSDNTNMFLGASVIYGTIAAFIIAMLCFLMLIIKDRNSINIKMKIFICLISGIITEILLFYVIIDSKSEKRNGSNNILVLAFIIILYGLQIAGIIEKEKTGDMKYKIYSDIRKKPYISNTEPWRYKDYLNVEIIDKQNRKSIISIPLKSILYIKTDILKKDNMTE